MALMCYKKAVFKDGEAMKKRIISILLLVLIVLCSLAFSSCLSKTERVLAKAISKTEKLDSFKAVSKTDICVTVNTNGTHATETTSTRTDVTVVDAKSDSPKIYLVHDMGGEYYIADGYVYPYSGKNNRWEVNEYFSLDRHVADAYILPSKKVLSKAEMSKSEKSDTISIAYSIPEDEFRDIYSSVIEETTEDLKNFDNIVIDNVNVVYTISSGYISKYEMSFDMKMSKNDVKVKAIANLEISFVHPGREYTITPPESYLIHK